MEFYSVVYFMDNESTLNILHHVNPYDSATNSLGCFYCQVFKLFCYWCKLSFTSACDVGTKFVFGGITIDSCDYPISHHYASDVPWGSVNHFLDIINPGKRAIIFLSHFYY